MPQESVEQYLAQHPLFRWLDSRYLALLAELSSNVTLKPGQYIYRQGSDADRFYIVLDGKVSVETQSPERASIVIQTLGPGEVLGWSWLFPPFRWHFDARCVETCRALALDGKRLREECEEDHDLGYELMKRFSAIIVERLQAARMQILDVYGGLV